MLLSRRAFGLLAAASLAACGRGGSRSDLHPGETPQMRALIRKYADILDIPESLLHRVIQRESGYNPAARNGPYYGFNESRAVMWYSKGYYYEAKRMGLLEETGLRS
jgi:hypothetical protein